LDPRSTATARMVADCLDGMCSWRRRCHLASPKCSVLYVVDTIRARIDPSAAY
jgi:hypothetical protein